MATPGGFLTEDDYRELSPVWRFYEAEFTNYVGATAAEAERLTYAFAVEASRRLPNGAGDSAHWDLGIGSGDPARTQWVMREFYREEEAERKRLCEQLISLGGNLPREWWEGHPEYQAQWNIWFGNPEGHWPDGVYRQHTQKEEEEGK